MIQPLRRAAVVAGLLFASALLTACSLRVGPQDQIGLSLGAWGAVQATCAGIGVALAAIVRHILVTAPSLAGLQPSTPYNVVFTIEMAFLVMAILIAIPLVIRRGVSRTSRPVATAQPKPVEAQ